MIPYGEYYGYRTDGEEWMDDDAWWMDDDEEYDSDEED